jgi:aldehyde dehydrogenase (NAD+)/betaine-aldehyde dehydrogenase
MDTGKPLTQARTDATVAARYFEFYANTIESFYGDTIPALAGTFVYTVREPFGVTGHIVPWNYPIQIGCRSVAPALAVGNCCVMKPAEEAPLTAVRVGELALEAGLPPGALNVVPGYGEEAGASLAAHPGINHLAFTGSPEVGQIVSKAAAENLIPVTMELGGKSPNIVFADADVENAIPVIVNSIIQNAGQTCAAGSRLLVQRRVHDEVVEKVAERFGGIEIGPGLDDPDLGPIISKDQRERVEGYVSRGKEEARLVLGGDVPQEERLRGGFFFEPTLFDGASPDAAIAQEEIFGPVLVASTFDDPEEATVLANGTEYGLIAAVWTRDVSKAHRLAKELRAGQVYINTYGAGGGVELPFGGFKRSGHGREKGYEALYEYSQVKTVALKYAT